MINAEAAFACFAEKKRVKKSKIDQMVDQADRKSRHFRTQIQTAPRANSMAISFP